jgi:hypothetical protein
MLRIPDLAEKIFLELVGLFAEVVLWSMYLRHVGDVIVA